MTNCNLCGADNGRQATSTCLFKFSVCVDRFVCIACNTMFADELLRLRTCATALPEHNKIYKQAYKSVREQYFCIAHVTVTE